MTVSISNDKHLKKKLNSIEYENVCNKPQNFFFVIIVILIKQQCCMLTFGESYGPIDPWVLFQQSY